MDAPPPQMRQKDIRWALVGMSNAGKSKAARRLAAEAGFFLRDVDAEIGRELGVDDIGALAAWLGLPNSSGFADRQQHYLALEERFSTAPEEKTPCVLDTTGSIVHLSERALKKIRSMYTVIHLDVGEHALEALIERFFATPKPVVWENYFSQNLGESADDALRRSYPHLLSERLSRFRALAHVNIPVHEMDFKSGKAIFDTIVKYV